MTQAPTIETQRLRLRPHVLADMDAFWAFYQSPRAEFVSAPGSRSDFWYKFASETGSWPLCGWRGWAIETKSGEFAGQVAIIQPPHFPELELGWILFEGFEGQGIAFEATGAARDWAFGAAQLPTLVSYVDRKNTRSRALAERLGARQDPNARVFDQDDVVYRHHPRGDA